jgi:hypothetical protein
VLSRTARPTIRLRSALMPAAAFAMFLAGCTGSGTPDVPTPTTTTGVAATPTSKPVAVATFAGCPARGAAIDVCNETFDIPAWGPGVPDPTCPQKAVKLTNGLYPKADGNPNDGVKKFVTADVNRDGLADAIVLLSCQIGDPSTQQVMVVSRTSTGALHTLGQVVGPTHGDIGFVEDIAADSDGSISALVVSQHGSVGGNLALRQWRTYRWDGPQFAQTAGSTSFNANTSVAKLTVTATPVTLAKPQGGQRRGTFTLTVKNTDTTAAKGVSVQVLPDYRNLMTVTSAECPVGAVVKVPTCAAGDLDPGASRTFSVALSIAADQVDTFPSNVPDGSPGDLRLLIGDQEYSRWPLPKASFA